MFKGVPGAQAQVVLDGTAGPAGRLDGPDHQITHDLGTLVGARNLFHSFLEFGLQFGESATFSGPASVERVLARVTGGTRSEIHGVLGSDILGADLYFLNPAGILFGPTAQLNLSGSFYASTADLLEFENGELFEARLGASVPMLAFAVHLSAARVLSWISQRIGTQENLSANI